MQRYLIFAVAISLGATTAPANAFEPKLCACLDTQTPSWAQRDGVATPIQAQAARTVSISAGHVDASGNTWRAPVFSSGAPHTENAAQADMSTTTKQGRA